MWSQNSFFPSADFIFSSSSSPPPHPLPHFHPLLPLLFSAPLPLKPAGKPLQKAPETPENSPRKTSQKTLAASSPPRKKKRRTPRKAFISGLLKGFGGGRKANGYSMAGKDLERRGRKTPSKALIITYFFFRHRKN